MLRESHPSAIASMVLFTRIISCGMHTVTASAPISSLQAIREKTSRSSSVTLRPGSASTARTNSLPRQTVSPISARSHVAKSELSQKLSDPPRELAPLGATGETDRLAEVFTSNGRPGPTPSM